jgi:hypothetical protein
MGDDREISRLKEKVKELEKENLKLRQLLERTIGRLKVGNVAMRKTLNESPYIPKFKKPRWESDE